MTDICLFEGRSLNKLSDSQNDPLPFIVIAEPIPQSQHFPHKVLQIHKLSKMLGIVVGPQTYDLNIERRVNGLGIAVFLMSQALHCQTHNPAKFFVTRVQALILHEGDVNGQDDAPVALFGVGVSVHLLHRVQGQIHKACAQVVGLGPEQLPVVLKAELAKVVSNAADGVLDDVLVHVHAHVADDLLELDWEVYVLVLGLLD